jgi:hypothetical protein
MAAAAPLVSYETASSPFPHPRGGPCAARPPRRRVAGAGPIALILVLATGPLSGCATLGVDGADTAQLADVATTGVGLSTGLVEANPVVAPLASAGPPGLVALAGVKLGLNRLARQQEPGLCRQWLGMSSAAGWAVATSNVAMLVAPPMAVLAIPMAVGMFHTAWDGSALETCYQGMVSEAILQVPEDTRLEQMPPAQRRALMQLVGVWPDPPMVPGSRPADGQILVQARLTAEPGRLEQFVRRHGLDWRLLAVQGPGEREMLVRDLPLLARHLSIVLGPDPGTPPDAGSWPPGAGGLGQVAIRRHRDDVWLVARASTPALPELDRSLARAP